MSDPGEDQPVQASVEASAPIAEASSVRELLKPRNVVRIELKAHFELDEARLFDLNGKGITLTAVTVN